MRTHDFGFDLPPELIAQHPSTRRDDSRLLVLHRQSGQWDHRHFREFGEFLRPGDVMVLNDSRVIPARLRGIKADSLGAFEILLLEELGPLEWWVLLRPGKRVRPGTRLLFIDHDGNRASLTASVIAKNDEGWCRLRFSGTADVRSLLGTLGEIPLPPYIGRSSPAIGPDDQERYQTVYASHAGSIAAPTAGLHFTNELLSSLAETGVGIHPITLHVGHGTFAPIKTEQVEDHVMHQEHFDVPTATVEAVNRAKAEGRRVVAVGTTTVRVLESVARLNHGQLVPGPGRTRIFLYPPARFQMVDALLTNFHLPESSLLMLVSAFAAPGEHPRGRDLIRDAYLDAMRKRYRFFSYGDAMFLT